MHRHLLLRGVSAGALFIVCSAAILPARAQETLPTIDIDASGEPAASHAPVSTWSPTLPDGKPAFVEKFRLPNTVASVTRKQIKETINIVDSQDALKYVPSLFVRKLRGGSEGMIQTRTWGLASARSMVFVDDLLISQLISNGHTDGQPRWGLVSPEEIERVDYLYGPFAAQYAGNSIGGVIKYTTRMPEKLEVTAKQTVSVQDYSWWGVSRAFVTETTALTAGDKIRDFSWFLALNYAHNENQPITYTNAGTGNLFPFPGGFYSQNKYGAPQNIVGSGSISDENFINGKLKLAYDITPTIRAAYTLGVYNSDRASWPENYISGGRNQLFGPAAGPGSIGTAALQGFGAANLRYQETIVTNALSVKSNTGGVFDWELSASHFTYPSSSQRSPWSALGSTAANPFGGYTMTGRDQKFTGTYWTLLDLNGILRPQGALAGHDISFGLHGDQYHMNNPIWVTTNWTAGQASSLGAAQSIAQGTTRTQALWVQDAWKFHPDFKLTVGGRWEHWQASDGYNQSTGLDATATAFTGTAAGRAPIFQPNLYHTRFSPKGALQWTPDENWTITGNIGLANRFPTVRELYNLSVTPGATGFVTNPNPNLRPEVSLSKEIAIERKLGTDGSARLSLFDDEVRDAIVSQTKFVTPAFQTATNQNVDRIRNSGFEIAAQKDNVILRGLELFGSVTFVNSRIISFRDWTPTAPSAAFPFGANFEFPWATSVSGKNAPGVPKWRWMAGATYRPDAHWAFTVAARWQDRIWTTLANNDVVHGIFGSSDRFFVVDLKAHYQWSERLSFDLGVDNVNNYKFALFHPFPQRTFVFSGKYEFGRGKGERGLFFEGGEPPPFDLSFLR